MDRNICLRYAIIVLPGPRQRYLERTDNLLQSVLRRY